MEMKKVFKLVSIDMKDVKKGDRIIIMYPYEEALEIAGGQFIFKAEEDATSQPGIKDPKLQIWGVKVKGSMVGG